MPKVALEFDLNADVLAAMCNSTDEPNHCPAEYGFKYPFYPAIQYCDTVRPDDWRAICLAEEKADGEA